MSVQYIQIVRNIIKKEPSESFIWNSKNLLTFHLRTSFPVDAIVINVCNIYYCHCPIKQIKMNNIRVYLFLFICSLSFPYLMFFYIIYSSISRLNLKPNCFAVNFKF